MFSTLAVIAAYLIGSIPFGYLAARWFRGIDIRTVGSGNIGATNVGRVLGFRFFLLVFALDMAKGLLPTLGFPAVFAMITGQSPPPELRVLVALATILGHNFPVYLNFKGGKGAATSLGAVLALDPISGLAAAIGFVGALAVFRYVSLSSVVGGFVFCLVHFMRVSEPWTRGERAMSVITIGLAVLLVARHRKNFARIIDGTEPKVGRANQGPPSHERSGRINLILLIGMAVVGVLSLCAVSACERIEGGKILSVGSYTVREVARAATGHQRAERLAFAPGGKLLAVTCPRYDRLVLYRVTDKDMLELFQDIELEGKPVAVVATRDGFKVLQRPSGDSRHVNPGWLQSYDFLGQPVETKVKVGFYPDDMALSNDSNHAFILTSGRAEGDGKKPVPALDVYEVETGKSVGRLLFETPGDDPARLILSNSGKHASVVLHGTNEVAAVDLSHPESPSLIGRSKLSDVARPYPSSRSQNDDWILMPVASGAEGLSFHARGLGDCVASSLTNESGLEFVRTSASVTQNLGRLTLRTGLFGLSKTRPIGLAFSAERNLLAVANRSGSVHLVAIRTSTESATLQTAGLEP